MAMAVGNGQQTQFSNMGYDAMRYPPPHFTNPWGSSPTSSQHLYATSLPQSTGSEQQSAMTPNASMAYGGSVPATSLAQGIASLDQAYAQQSLPYPQDLKYAPRPYVASYASSTASSAGSFAPTSAPQYPAEVLSRSPYGYQSDRRPSHPSIASSDLQDSREIHQLRQSSLVDFNRLNGASEAERNSFSDALDASRGMVAMSQDITPRNIYGNQNSSRSSTDSYGFPSTHSSHSSVSSASTYPAYYNSSVSEASVGDYSSAGESVDMPSRTLPRPNGLVGGPPAPQSMMGQFSSKVSSSSQKKHKCKICDKRFTRPSSLQTHMYSHTGEKPFTCDVDGCGRHFSVVSNLRRHRKVHRGELDLPSPDDED